MKKWTLINKPNALKLVSLYGSLLTPLIHNRFVPYPFWMSVVVTRQCNSRCKMCTIWQDTDLPQLSLAQFEHIFAKNDFSFIHGLTLTGGEATLRRDLPEIFALGLTYLPNLEYAFLATHGLNTRRTIKYVREMLKMAATQKNRLYRLHIQISLDGVGDVHDTTRGIPGFFNKVETTLAELQALQQDYPLLYLSLNCVLMPSNLPHLPSLKAFANKHHLPITYALPVLTGDYYDNLETGSEITLVADHLTAAQQFLTDLGERDQSATRFYYQDMAHMLEGNPRERTCMMGYYNFILEHDGNVYPCYTSETHPFGNLLTESFESVWFGEQANASRQYTQESCCPGCPASCYTHPVSPREVAQLIKLQYKPRLPLAKNVLAYFGEKP